MKYFILLTFYFSVLEFNSQTLTQAAHEPNISDIRDGRLLDTSLYTTGMPANLTGANVVWDFSKLKAQSTTFLTTYDLPSSTTLSAGYPSATIVENQGNIYTFMKSVTSPTTQTEVLGIASTQLSTTFTDPAISLIYPVSLGSSHTDNIAGTYTFGTINGNCTGKIATVADGSGTLTLPFGITYKNVLRVKSTQTITASLGTIKQNLIYFFDTSDKFPILTLNYGSLSFAFGSPTITAVVSGLTKAFPVGLEQLDPNNAQISVYPNPANSFITIQSNSTAQTNLQVEIFNILGEKVKSAALENKDSNTLDVQDLAKGLYTITLSGNKVFATKKLVVQ